MNLSRILIFSVVFLLVGISGALGISLLILTDDTTDVAEQQIIKIKNTSKIDVVVSPQLTPQPIEYLDRVDQWTCYDYSIEFNKQNPKWGLVVLSDKMSFQGECHIVNYRINEDKILTLHDEWNQIEYNNTGWELTDDICSPDHFHFFYNGELPRRSWRMLRPNAEAVYNAL